MKIFNRRALCVIGCMWGLFVFFLSGFVILHCASIACKTISYSKMQGTVVESRLASSVNSRGVTFFKPDVCIAYSTTNGTCFARKVLPFGGCSSSIRFIAEATSKDFIKGQSRSIYCNNKDASDSFICHFGCFEMLVLSLGLLFFIGSAVVFFVCFACAKGVGA